MDKRYRNFYEQKKGAIGTVGVKMNLGKTKVIFNKHIAKQQIIIIIGNFILVEIDKTFTLNNF